MSAVTAEWREQGEVGETKAAGEASQGRAKGYLDPMP